MSGHKWRAAAKTTRHCRTKMAPVFRCREQNPIENVLRPAFLARREKRRLLFFEISRNKLIQDLKKSLTEQKGPDN
jgi:hypothetical protein